MDAEKETTTIVNEILEDDIDYDYSGDNNDAIKTADKESSTRSLQDDFNIETTTINIKTFVDDPITTLNVDSQENLSKSTEKILELATEKIFEFATESFETTSKTVDYTTKSSIIISTTDSDHTKDNDTKDDALPYFIQKRILDVFTNEIGKIFFNVKKCLVSLNLIYIFD